MSVALAVELLPDEQFPTLHGMYFNGWQMSSDGTLLAVLSLERVLPLTKKDGMVWHVSKKEMVWNKSDIGSVNTLANDSEAKAETLR